MNFRILMCLLPALLLGCTLKPPPVPSTLPPLLPERQHIMIPTEDTRECEELPHFILSPGTEELTEEQVVEVLVKWSTLYRACSDRQRRLSNTVRDAFNLGVSGNEIPRLPSVSDSVNK